MRKSERRQLVGVSALAVTSIALVTILTLRIGDLESSDASGRQQAGPRSDIDGDSDEVAATSRGLREVDSGGPPSTIDGERKRLASDLTWSDLGMDPAHVIEFTADQQRIPSVDDVSPASDAEGSDVAIGKSRSGLVVTSMDAGASDENDDTAASGGVESLNDDGELGESPSVVPTNDAGAADAGGVPARSSLGEPLEALSECGMITCGPGEVCCNASCAICAEPGVYCKSEPCDMKFLQTGELCGLQSCSFGSTCCCGTCIAPGQSCDPDDCAIASGLELSEPCGTMTLCGEGEVCCNPSCGTCVQPGDTCSQQVCD